MSCASPNHSHASRRLPFRAFAISNFIQVALLASVILFAAFACNQSADAQLRGLKRSRFNNRPTVFTGVTRQLLRPLRLAEAAIKTQDYENACLLIGEMLDDDGLKDCLVPDDQDWGHAVSLRQKALDLLGTMNEDQRSAYREKYATRSTQLLEKAIEARDYRGIEFVSERYLYTDAGLEATMLLGHYWLNEGRPETSAGAFTKLLEIPRGRQLYDPELTLLSAIACALSKQEETAISHLERLKEMKVKQVAFFQRDVSIYSDDQQPLEWLTSLIGESPLKTNAIVSQWLMWQGNPQRNAEAGPGFPLFSPRWLSETLGEYESVSELENWIDVMAKNQVSPVPKTNLLTIGDTIVIRTAEEMIAIEAATGKRRWSFPGTEAELEGSYSDPKKKSTRVAPESIEVGKKGRRHQARKDKYYERVVQDTIFSQISSDGKLVFCIPNPGVATTENDWLRYRGDRFESPTDLRKYNELCAIDVASEGSLAWQVGGVSGGDEGKLARTFFLGCPLPLDGSLYCVCVQDQLVKLVVLDAINGSLQWEKELASTEDGVNFTQDVVRRLAGASPSASDGVVVCPTRLNAIVAVDIGTRSLKWGFQFSEAELINHRRTSSQRDNFWESYENVWRDRSLRVSDGSVLFTPADSKELCCLDLMTGRSRWNRADKKTTTFRRSNDMYVANVKNGQIVLVAPGSLRGVSLDRGEDLWTIPFANHGTVSGHGYAHGNSYYLPTTSKKLIRFDLVKEAISKVVDTERVLGNLYPWNADIISVGLDHIAAYPCDVKSQRIFEIGDANGEVPNPPRWKPHARLAIKAQLRMQQGNYPEAARLISEAYDLFPNSSYAGVLVEVLTEMIAVDFKQAEAIFQRYQGLFKQRDMNRLLQGKVNGLVTSQRYEEAFATLLEIANGIDFADRRTTNSAETAIGGSELVQLFTTGIDLSPAMARSEQNGVVEISKTSWLRWQLTLLASRLIAKSKMNVETKITREDLKDLIAKHLEPFAQEDTEAFFQRLRLFPLDLIEPALIVETAQRLLTGQQRIEAKNLLLESWSDEGVAPQVVAQRLKLLGQIAIDQQDGATARALASRLEEENADLNEQEVAKLRQQTESLQKALDENVYDDQLYLKLARDKAVVRGPRYDLGGVQWKRELAEIGKAQYAPVGNGRHKCNILETDVPEIHKLVFRYEAKATRGELLIHDSLGRQIRSVYLRHNGSMDSFASGTTGKIFLKNSVMLFCIGKAIFALDWIRTVRGKDPVMWSVRLEYGTSTRNVFGGPRSDGVCFVDGDELKCVDLFTGKIRWVRNQIPHQSMIKEGGDRITVWKDNIYETFDKLSGRRIASDRVSKLGGLTSTGHNHFHLFRMDIRSKPNNAEPSKRGISAPDDPFAQEPYTVVKLHMFDFEVGEVAWERSFPFPSVFRQVDENSIAVLTGGGVLSLLDLPTGKSRFEQKIEGLKDIPAVQLSVTPMAQGYVFVVGTSEGGSSKVKQDEKTEVIFSSLKSRGWLRSGYIFAVESDTGKSIWSKPVRFQSFGLLDGTPYNSPFLMLFRRASYRPVAVRANRATGNKTRIQVAMLDVATGQLKNNYLLKAGVVSEPRVQMVCRPGKEYQSNQDDQSEQQEINQDDAENQRLELLFASQRYSVQLTESEGDAKTTSPAVLNHESSVMKLGDDVEKIAEGEGVNLVVDLEPLAQRAKEANEAMLELGKLEAELFEKQRKARQQQR